MKTAVKETTAKAPATGLVYTVGEGLRHVDVLRAMLQAGNATKDILGAYVEARLPEFAKRDAYKGKTQDALRKIVRKHGRTHLNMALAVMNPVSIAEQVEKADATILRATRTLEAAKARKASAQQAQAQAKAKA